MSGAWTIYRRELSGLFFQPLAWVLLFLALLFNGGMLILMLRGSGGDVNLALAAALGGWGFWILACVLGPLVTMRMISEESRSGLLEFLLTAPVRDGAVVFGKYLAASTFFAVLWISVPLYGVLFEILGVSPDWGQTLSAYVGAVLVSSLFCALGLAASALTSTPALAAFLAFLSGIGVLLLPQAGRSLATQVGDRWVEPVLSKIDLIDRLQASFIVGAIDTSHVLFFLAWIAALLFVTTRLLEARRWR